MKRDKTGYTIFAVIILVLIWSAIQASGQETNLGFGGAATGGEGGQVVTVTRYDDPLDITRWNAQNWVPGTLRWALAQPSPKIIRFSEDKPVWMTASVVQPLRDTTIEGPVTIIGDFEFGNRNDSTIKNGNIIVRKLRIRNRFGENWKPFEGGPRSGGRGLMFIRSGAAGPMLVQQVSIACCADQAFTHYYGKGPLTLDRVLLCEGMRLVAPFAETVKGTLTKTLRNIRWHTEGGHDYGPIIASPNHGVTIQGCAMLNLTKRMPWGSGFDKAGLPFQGDVRNNVFFGWYSHSGSTQNGSRGLVAGNIWKASTLTPKVKIGCGYGGTNNFVDNVLLNPDGSIVTRDVITKMAYPSHVKDWMPPHPAPYQPVAEDPAETLNMILDNVGCFPRDRLDIRQIESAKTGVHHRGAPTAMLTKTLEEYLTDATTIDDQPLPAPVAIVVLSVDGVDLADGAVVDFGRVDVGEIVSRQLIIRNDGLSDLVLKNVVFPAGYNLRGFTGGPVQITIAPQGSIDGPLGLDTSVAGTFAGDWVLTTDSGDTITHRLTATVGPTEPLPDPEPDPEPTPDPEPDYVTDDELIDAIRAKHAAERIIRQWESEQE